MKLNKTEIAIVSLISITFILFNVMASSIIISNFTNLNQSENLSFSGNMDITRYLSIPYSIYNVTQSNLNITGISNSTYPNNPYLQIGDSINNNSVFLYSNIDLDGDNEILYNFTVLVNLSYDSNMKTDFQDIQFFNNGCSGTQSEELNFEFDRILNSNSAIVWVKIPQLNNGIRNTTICLRFGNSSQNYTQNPRDAWDKYYVAIWHFVNVTNPVETISQNNYSWVGTPSYLYNTSLGNGINLFPAGAKLTGKVNPNFLSGTTNATFEILSFKTSDLTNDMSGSMYQSDGVNPAFNIGYYGEGGNPATPAPWLYNGGSADASWTATNYGNTWQYIQRIFNSNANAIAFQNKNLLTWKYASTPISTIYNSNANVTFGGSVGDGMFDEARISNTTRSSAWLNRSYDNLNFSKSLVSSTISKSNSWSYSGYFSINQKTIDLSLLILDAYNNSLCNCLNCNKTANTCKIPFLFHSDSQGILSYTNLIVNYSESSIYFTDPTESNNSFYTRKNIQVNVSVNDTNYNNFTINLYNKSGLVNYYDRFNYSCYQESANTTNQTGIDGICGLNYSGSYIGTNITQLVGNVNNNAITDYIDGVWTTGIANNVVGGISQVYINYSKPNLQVINAIWQIRAGSPANTYNISIPNVCNNNVISLMSESMGANINNSYYCYNGSSYILLYTNLNDDYLWEEAIIWNIKSSNLYYNFSNLNDGIYYFNSTKFESNGINYSTETRQITIDNQYPNATLIFPGNNSYLNNQTQNFTVNLTDNVGLSNSTLFIYQHLGSLYNSTLTILTGTTNLILGTLVVLTDGVYDWFYQVTDTSGNSYTTSNNTLSIDTLIPTITNFNPSIGNSYSTNNNFEISITSYKSDLFSNISSAIAVLIYPNSTIRNISLSSVGNNKYNSSFLSNLAGQYNINFIVNDTFNNVNNINSTYFTLTENSNIVNSILTNSTVINSTLLNSNISLSNITNSTINNAVINNSIVSNSILNNFTSNNCTVINSTLSGVICNNLVINNVNSLPSIISLNATKNKLGENQIIKSYLNIVSGDPIVYCNFTIVKPNGNFLINNINGSNSSNSIWNSSSVFLDSIGNYTMNVSCYDFLGFVYFKSSNFSVDYNLYISPDPEINYSIVVLSNSDKNKTYTINLTLSDDSNGTINYNLNSTISPFDNFTLNFSSYNLTLDSNDPKVAIMYINTSSSSIATGTYYGNISITNSTLNISKLINFIFAINPPAGNPIIYDQIGTNICSNSPLDSFCAFTTSLNPSATITQGSSTTINYRVKNNGYYNLTGCSVQGTNDFYNKTWITSSPSLFNLTINETKNFALTLSPTTLVTSQTYIGYINIKCLSSDAFGDSTGGDNFNWPYLRVFISPAPSTPSSPGGGGGNTQNKTELLEGFCGNRICESKYNETYNTCPADCQGNLEPITSCLSFNSETRQNCILLKGTALTWVFLVIILVLIFITFFEVRTGNNKYKNTSSFTNINLIGRKKR